MRKIFLNIVISYLLVALATQLPEVHQGAYYGSHLARTPSPSLWPVPMFVLCAFKLESIGI